MTSTEGFGSPYPPPTPAPGAGTGPYVPPVAPAGYDPRPYEEPTVWAPPPGDADVRRSTTGQSTTDQSAGDQSTAGVAKDQAASVAGGAADAAKNVASVAKEQVGQVATEAKKQVRDLVGQARSELTDQAQVQQQRVAGGLHSVGDQLRAMAQGSDQPGAATDLAHQAADKAHQVAQWLENRDPGSVLDEVRSFARQRPGAFLAIALGAGIVTGRLVRGLAADTAETGSTANVIGTGTTGPSPRSTALTAGYAGRTALPGAAETGRYSMATEWSDPR